MSDSLVRRISELEAEVKTLKHIITVDNEKDILDIRIRALEAAIQWALDSGDVFYPKDVGDRLRDALAGAPRPPVYGLNCGVDLRTGKGVCVCGRCSPDSGEVNDPHKG